MHIDVLAAGELTPALAERWTALIDGNPDLRTPMLRPQLFRLIGRDLPNARVAVLSGQSGPEAVFPYLATPHDALPVPMCDYQAVVSSAGYAVDLRQTLRMCGLTGWTFDAWIGSGPMAAQSTVLRRDTSPRVTLPGGDVEAYRQELRAAGRSMRNLATKRRLLERDHGPIRFELHAGTREPLESILRWKDLRFGGVDSVWVRSVLEAVLTSADDDFTGVLSALYAGDRLVAAHLGIRSADTLYYWFPAFDDAFSRYTPGWIMVNHLIDSLPVLGCTTLDFGPGGERYKRYFANDGLPYLAGVVECRTPRNLMRAAARNSATFIRSHPGLYGPAQRVAGAMRRAR